ncbi:type 1 glutamine amidotransferase [Candidatus Uhrbacteria bacterium]|nr:type 1 glutamine amidotransferase [Candidatus Uhrbacteria bacterium]
MTTEQPPRPLRVLLLQAREHHREIEFEQSAFDAALQGESLYPLSINLVEHPAGLPLPTEAQAVIIAGSPFSVASPVEGFTALRRLLDRMRRDKTPIFGICFGAQFIADHFGGSVAIGADCWEEGTTRVRKIPDVTHPIWSDLPHAFDVQQSHDDHIAELPIGAVVLAENERCPIQAFSFEDGRFIGTQFHPERTPEWYDAVLRSPHGLPPEKVARYCDYTYTMRPSPEAHSLLRRFIAYARSVAPR